MSGRVPTTSTASASTSARGMASHSGSRSGTRMRLRQLSSTGGRPFSRTLNKNACLPSIGHTFNHPSASTFSTTTVSPSMAGALAAVSTTPPLSSTLAEAAAISSSSSHAVAAEALAEAAAAAATSTSPDESQCDPTIVSSLLSNATPILRPFPPDDLEDGGISAASASPGIAGGGGGGSRVRIGGESGGDSPTSPSAPKETHVSFASPVAAGGGGEGSMISAEKSETSLLETLGEVLKRSSPRGNRKEMSTVSSAGASSRPTSTRFHGLDHLRRKDFSLESLSTGEARSVSGILRQASIEKLGTSHIGSLVSSASKSRMGNYCIQEARIPTLESRLVMKISFCFCLFTVLYRRY